MFYGCKKSSPLRLEPGLPSRLTTAQLQRLRFPFAHKPFKRTLFQSESHLDPTKMKCEKVHQEVRILSVKQKLRTEDTHI